MRDDDTGTARDEDVRIYRGAGFVLIDLKEE